MKNTLLIHAWQLEKKESFYYLPYTHWIYLKEISKYYDEIILLSSCKILKSHTNTKSFNINNLGNIKVFELPLSVSGYIGSLKYLFFYINAYRSIKNISTYYSRYPTPFGWLQKIYGKGKSRIIHYVGDPADAAKNNPNFSIFKKAILIAGFSLENALYTWACRGAKVYTNGYHLSTKLHKKGITAKPLISSTLTETDFFYSDNNISPETASFIYLGYLRTAKGIETILDAFFLYNKNYPSSSFTIVGTGELDSKLKTIVKNKKINNVRFLGHIEDRAMLNQELRSADVFLFASLSEGSPRVVLEAMANSLVVISTPVGSLPTVFEDGKDIVFADFNNSIDFLEKMLLLTRDEEKYKRIKQASYSKVEGFTINNFIKEIFDEKI